MNLVRILSLTIVLSFATIVKAQTIKGKVTDKQNLPVSFATAVLQSLPDSTILKTELTDSAGNFAMAELSNYPALVTIAIPGYKTQSKVISAATDHANFVLESTSNTLSGVTVSAQKKLIERKIDRTVFNVESSISSIGSDAFEALKRAPGVRVNNSNISIAGKSSVSVTINDKLIKLSGEELEALLRSIPADNLSKIEVITTPPAKYDAEGNSGIINLVTKKQLNNGLNGNITARYAQRTNGCKNLDGAFNWRQGKLNVFGNGNNNVLSYTNPQNTTTYYPTQRQEMHLDEVDKPWYYRFEVGADYELTPKSVLGVLYTNGNMDRNEDQAYTTNVFVIPNGYVDSILRTDAHTHEFGHRDVLNVNYEWNIDTTGKKINADIDYFNRYGDNDRSFNTQNFLTDETPTSSKQLNKTYGYQHIVVTTGKIDVTWPTKITMLSFGGKISSVHNYSDNQFTFLQGEKFVTDLNKTNQFDYTENTQALYLSAQKPLNKWQLQGGLRGEYTQTKGVSATLNQTNTNDYFKLFPTAYVQYTPNETHSFGINYSRRIHRPQFWWMNPFRRYFTPTSYEQGNPFLQPQFSHNVELSYSLHNNYTFTLYTQHIQDYFTPVSLIDSTNNSFYLNMANAGTANNSGLRVSANVTPAKWWEATMELNGFYHNFKATYYNSSTFNGRVALFTEINNSFTLNRSKTLLAELGGYYESTRLDDIEIAYWNSEIWMGVKALFFRKKLTLAVNVYDPLKTGYERRLNVFNNTYRHNYFDSRSVHFSLSWKFGNRNIKEKRQRNTSSDETRRAG